MNAFETSPDQYVNMKVRTTWTDRSVYRTSANPPAAGSHNGGSLPYNVTRSMKRIIRVLVCTLALATAFGQSSNAEKTYAQIKQEIIKRSIAGYKVEAFTLVPERQ